MDLDKQIEATANRLLPLYATEEADLPNRPLWAHPEISRVIEALRLLADVLFPGKHLPEPADFRTFFTDQLSAAADILVQEVQKALPIRWMGAADLHEKRRPIEDLPGESGNIVRQFIQVVPVQSTNARIFTHLI